jgi:hypothetical protein
MYGLALTRAIRSRSIGTAGVFNPPSSLRAKNGLRSQQTGAEYADFSDCFDDGDRDYNEMIGADIGSALVVISFFIGIPILYLSLILPFLRLVASVQNAPHAAMVLSPIPVYARFGRDISKRERVGSLDGDYDKFEFQEAIDVDELMLELYRRRGMSNRADAENRLDL